MSDQDGSVEGGALRGAGTPDALVTLAQLADLEVIAASIPVGIFRAEFGRGLVYANDRLLEIVGMSRADLLGEGWTRGVHPDDRERLAAERAQNRARPSELHLEYRVIRSDGIVRWIALRASQFFDEDGAPAGMVGAVEDVTDRVLAEQDAARLSALCEQTTDFVVVSGADGRIVYANGAAQDVLGVDPGARPRGSTRCTPTRVGRASPSCSRSRSSGGPRAASSRCAPPTTSRSRSPR